MRTVLLDLPDHLLSHILRRDGWLPGGPNGDGAAAVPVRRVCRRFDRLRTGGHTWATIDGLAGWVAFCAARATVAALRWRMDPDDLRRLRQLGGRGEHARSWLEAADAPGAPPPLLTDLVLEIETDGGDHFDDDAECARAVAVALTCGQTWRSVNHHPHHHHPVAVALLLRIRTDGADGWAGTVDGGALAVSWVRRCLAPLVASAGTPRTRLARLRLRVEERGARPDDVLVGWTVPPHLLRALPPLLSVERLVVELPALRVASRSAVRADDWNTFVTDLGRLCAASSRTLRRLELTLRDVPREALQRLGPEVLLASPPCTAVHLCLLDGTLDDDTLRRWTALPAYGGRKAMALDGIGWHLLQLGPV